MSKPHPILRVFILAIPVLIGMAFAMPPPFPGVILATLAVASCAMVLWQEGILRFFVHVLRGIVNLVRQIVAFIFSIPRRIAALIAFLMSIPPRLYARMAAWRTWVFLLVTMAVALFILCAIDIIQTAKVAQLAVKYPEDAYNVFPFVGFALMGLGGVLLMVAIGILRQHRALPALMPVTANPTDTWRVGWLPLIAGILILSFVTLCSAGSVDASIIQGVTWRIQEILFYPGIILIGYGLGGAPRLRNPFRRREEQPDTDIRRDAQRGVRGVLSRLLNNEVLIVAAICTLAFFLRTWATGTTLRLLIDEQNFIDTIRHSQGDLYLHIIRPTGSSAPYTWLFSLLQADIDWVLGHGLGSLRLTSAILEVAQVAALYGLARTLFDRRTAILAALALAVFAPHIHYGRTIYSPHPGDTLFGLLTLTFVARALRGNRALDWAIAGVCLGMTHYFYEAGRLFFAPFVVLWIVMLALWGQTEDGQPIRRVLWKQMRGGLARMIACFILIAAPVYVVLISSGDDLSYRLSGEGLGVEYYQELLQDGISDYEFNHQVDRLARPFLFYVYVPENSARYYGGTEPLILRAMTPLFFLGVFILLGRPRSPAFGVLVWVFAVAMANALFIREAIWTPRYTVVVPALALIIAVGIRYTPTLLFAAPEVPVNRPFWRNLLPAGLIAVFGFLNVTYYFGPHLDNLTYFHRNWLTFGDIHDMVLRLYEQLPPDVSVVIVGLPPPPTDEPHRFWEYLEGGHDMPQFNGIEPGMVSPRFLLNLQPGFNRAFFVETQWTSVIQLIYEYFPNAEPPAYTTTDMAPDEQYMLIYVPK